MNKYLLVNRLKLNRIANNCKNGYIVVFSDSIDNLLSNKEFKWAFTHLFGSDIKTLSSFYLIYNRDKENVPLSNFNELCKFVECQSFISKRQNDINWLNQYEYLYHETGPSSYNERIRRVQKGEYFLDDPTIKKFEYEEYKSIHKGMSDWQLSEQFAVDINKI